MTKAEPFTIVFPDRGHADPDVREIAEFLTLFRGAYVAGLRVLQSPTGRDLSPRRLATRLKGELAKLNAAETTDLFGERRRHVLRTKRITHDSPIEITLVGLAVALGATAILSGGTFKLGGVLSVELNRGLPESIEALRALFAKRTRAELGYGVQEREITLNSGEIEELNKTKPEQEKGGGFQRRLVAFQKRVVRRKLKLSADDIDWILRHGEHPGKGGYQSRIRKIFERHFW